MNFLHAFKNKTRGYFFNPKMRKTFARSKEFSSKYIKPVVPALHEFMFETLKRYVKRKIIRSLLFSKIDTIDQSSLYHCDQSKNRERNPRISVIVPNYNHEKFLRKRLESIYSQTYKNFEVILLDDNSTDKSSEILDEYAQRYSNNTRLIVNSVNSGGVFNQWKKGIELATGELVWIAESDDFCLPDLLEKLVVFFDNDAIMLAYSKSIFVQGEDEKEVWSINDYLDDIDKELWNEPFISSAHRLVNEAWAIKNIVPNASSAIFRNPKHLKLLENKDWQKMRICGDWMFYLHIIRGGLVAYTPTTTNYYRLHDKNTSVATYSQEVYYKEHQQIASTICALYHVETSTMERQRESLLKHWYTHVHHKNDNDFLALYDLASVLEESLKRKPNIMMATFAFAAGGGETFPIKLANMLSTIGYGVTMLNFGQAEEEPGIRRMLSSHIPILNVTCIEKIAVICEDMGIEIIHSHHAWVDMTLAALLTDNESIKMVISIHGMYEMMSKEEFKEAFLLLEKRVDKIVYTAKKNLRPFQSLPYQEDFLVEIGNALEATPINIISRETLGLSKDDFVICLVSRAIPEKGWEEAIQSIEIARNISNVEIHLLLIGEGEEYTRLKHSIHHNFIHFLGFKANIRDYFAASDLGFLPSRFAGESFPLVIIDCLYSNKPMLASNLGEINNMLKKGPYSTGAVFDLENMQIPIHTVASMIAKFATDRSYYDECSRYIPEVMIKYDPDEMVKKYDSVYRKLLHKSQF